MTSSWLIRIIYIAILTGSVEHVRGESSPSVDRKQDEQEDIIGEPGIAAYETRFPADAAAKRKWGENTMSTWGKRSSEPSDALSLMSLKKARCLEAVTSSARDRRKWGEKSMGAWGKRSVGIGGCEDDDDVGSSGTIGVEHSDKRKWGENTMQVWGKRAPSSASLIDEETVADASDYDDYASASAEKRKWGDKSMSAWGKRRREATADEATSNRKWGSNSMTAWGKRGGELLPNSGVLNGVLLDSDSGTNVIRSTDSKIKDDRPSSSTEHVNGSIVD